MDYIRTIVSGKKKRLKEEGFNLDLSYITPRIIAMSIPGEGLSGLYRNNLNLVSEFLETRHKNKYQVYNLSGIPYNYDKFAEQVKEFPWEDHYPPPIDLLFSACKSIETWLESNILNVIAVNCRAGKGRTGTLICCYLLYSGFFTEPESALRYYKIKRFEEGGGVTQPSQVRYVKYFSMILEGKVQGPLALKPILMQFRTAPHFTEKSCKPIIEIYYQNTLIYSNKKHERGLQVHLTDEWDSNRLHTVSVFSPLVLQGDILVKVLNWGKFRISNVCRFSFNTGFVPYNHILVLHKYDLDPYKFKKNSDTSDNFSIILQFEQLCDCKSALSLSSRCEICKNHLNPIEVEKWASILEIISSRSIIDQKENLFGLSEDDSNSVLEQFENSLDGELEDYRRRK